MNKALMTAVIVLPLVMFLAFFGENIMMNFEDNAAGARKSTLISKEVVRLVGTDRIVTQVVVEDDESSLLGGADRVIAAGTVTLLIGIDMDKATIADQGTNPITIIRLPPPEILSTDLDEQSVMYFRKATVVQRLSDLDAPDRQNRIRQKLKDTSHDFVKVNGLLPSQADIEKRVRDLLVSLGHDNTVEFRALTN